MDEQVFWGLSSQKKEGFSHAITLLSSPILSHNNTDNTDHEKHTLSDTPELLLTYLTLCNSVISFYDTINTVLTNFNVKKSSLIIINNPDKQEELKNQFINAIKNAIAKIEQNLLANMDKNIFPPLLINLRELLNTQETQPDVDKLATLLMGRKHVNPYSENVTNGVQSEIVSEITSLYKEQNLRIRNCHKRYANAKKKFKLLHSNGNYHLIQLNFAIQDAIFDTTKTFFNTETSKNFVNRFIALRSKKQYKSHFTGLAGYMKKLILVNNQQANGGMITLIFNQSNPNFESNITNIQSSYLEFAKYLNDLLCDMAKEDGITIESGFSTRFAPNSISYPNCRAFISRLITFYAYSDYVTSLKDNELTPIPEAKGTLRSFEVTFYKAIKNPV